MQYLLLCEDVVCTLNTAQHHMSVYVFVCVKDVRNRKRNIELHYYLNGIPI